MEPIDQQAVYRVAQELQGELHSYHMEQYGPKDPSTRTGPLRFFHRFADAVSRWCFERRQGKRAGMPLITRPWVPWVLAAGVVAIWTPDRYKINLLYALDDWHEHIKLRVHCWYWRMTMEPEQYAVLMEQLEQNIPKSKRSKSPDCPL